MEALRDLTSPRALVVREGEAQRIAGREVVRGDIVILAEGDRVLTGPVRKLKDLKDRASAELKRKSDTQLEEEAKKRKGGKS